MAGRISKTLNWDMSNLSKEGKKLSYQEVIDSNVWQSKDYCGFGTYYTNFAWVYCITNNITIANDESENLEFLCKFIGIDVEKNKNAQLTIAFEAIKELIHCIYNFSFYCIGNSQAGNRKSESIYEIITRQQGVSIDERNQRYSKTNICLKYLFDGAKTVNYLLSKITSGDSQNIINEIVTAIQTYIVQGNPEEKYDLLKKYCDNSEDKNRCVAAYVFNHMQNDMRGYIAFSGFHDVEDQDILDKFNEIEKNTKISRNYSFIKKLIEISEELKFILVITNKFTSVYKTPYGVYNGNIELKYTLGNELATLNKKRKGLYSCSERKIFTAFYPSISLFCLPEEICNKYSVGYYVGKLYIAKEPCGECCTGIKYEWENGHVFEVYPQIQS